jgi:predicted DCC family thiol-disulfide oxidoreductase YuxK
MCLMHEDREGALIVLYDGDCGFCEVMLAMLLAWDRPKRLGPVSIQSPRGEELLFDMARPDRLQSWHLIDAEGVLYSGGAGISVIFAALPWGALIARVASRFPRTTSRAYDWVASHRVLLGRLLKARSRAWAARVIAERVSRGQEPPLVAGRKVVCGGRSADAPISRKSS